MIAVEYASLRCQRFSMSPGIRESAHAHETWHLLRVEAGDFEEGDGRNGMRVRVGGWRLSPPRLTHELIAGATGAICANLHIRDRDLARRLFTSIDHRHHFIDHLPRPPVAGGLAASHAIVAAVIRHVCGDDSEPPEWLVELQNRICDPRSRITDVSLRLGVSREHASREFRRYFGLAPTKARLLAAAEQAIGLLVEKARPLCDVALDAGFYDQAHMTRTLRKVCGSTPSKLRNHFTASH